MKKNEPGKPKKESRLEKVIVFLLVVLISLLSFSVGVISGKGLSDKEYALKSIDQKYSHAMNSEGTPADEGDGDLSEEEIQQLANAAIQAAEKNGGDTAHDAAPAGHDDHAVAATDKKAAHGADAHAAPAPGATAAHDSHDTPKAAPAKVAAKESTKAVEDERLPSSVKKGAAGTEYTVQVASYPSSKDAEAMSASLIKKGYPAFPFKVSINGADWYRVSVGSFKTRGEAMSYQNDLKKQGVVKDAVVQKLTK